MRLYIDPGTGSMLFAILIGIIGAANYLIKKWLVKVRFFLSGGKHEKVDTETLPFVIFSDDKRYWKNFEPICSEFDKRGINVTYMTASPDDPALNNSYEHIHGEFIGTGNKAYSRLNFLNAEIVLATTPNLDVYQWKRSKDVSCYVHLLHMANDPTLYRMFALDYYDAVLISGDYQAEQIRKLEKLRNLCPKDLVKIGIPYMDEMAKTVDGNHEEDKDYKTVLLAPSWGKSAIFSRFGGKIVDELLKTEYHIIIRPHPQSFTSEKDLMDSLMKKYPASEKLEWDRKSDNHESLSKADIMISDFSGVVFEFVLVYDKPVIYANTEFDDSPYDAWWLDETPWTFKSLPLIGTELTEDALCNLQSIISSCMDDSNFKDNRERLRNETWAYPGEGAVRAVDYLIEKHHSITSWKEENT